MHGLSLEPELLMWQAMVCRHSNLPQTRLLASCYDPNPRVVRVSDKVLLVGAWAAEECVQPLD